MSSTSTISPAPIVTLIPPSPSLTYSHHVPTPKIPASSSKLVNHPNSKSYSNSEIPTVSVDFQAQSPPIESSVKVQVHQIPAQIQKKNVTLSPALHHLSFPCYPSHPAQPLNISLTAPYCSTPDRQSKSKNQTETDAFYPSRPKPKSFCNPWPSYRTASLNDAWLSYQKGAAIAPHALTPSQSRPPSRAGIKGSSGTSDDEADASSLESTSRKRCGNTTSLRERLDGNDLEMIEDEDDRKEEEEEDPDTEMEIQTNTSLPTKVYARPELLQVMEGDDDDDWRNPPIKVVKPAWVRAEATIDEKAHNEGGESVDESALGGDLGSEKIKAKNAATDVVEFPRSVTWLGHASVLVQVPFDDGSGSCGILFDPIFSHRCSPSQMVGPARSLEPPCKVSDLPPIHLCLISHDHYDHLDLNTILDLWKSHQNTIQFFVPFGLKKWFVSSRIPESRITELDWWHESFVTIPSTTPFVSELSTASPSASASTVSFTDSNTTTKSSTLANISKESTGLRLKVAFTPAQHRSGRGAWDQMTTLWGSWCVGVVDDQKLEKVMERGMIGWESFKIFFGGDTGYRYATAPENDPDSICPAFKQIADLYSPFSLSLLPISTGSSLPFLRSVLSLSLDQYILTSSLHCSPYDSLEIHSLIKAKRSIGIHWGTFCDTEEARGTRVELGRFRREKDVGKWWDVDDDNGCFVVTDIGQTMGL